MGQETLPFKDRLLLGPPVDGSTQYDKSTGIDLSAANYTITGRNVINSLWVTEGSGDIDVSFESGGRMVIPVTVSAGDSKEILKWWRITTIHMTTTTFSGYIFPSF